MTTQHKSKTSFKSYFFRGMAALLPTILTIWIFAQTYIFIEQNISVHINRGMVRAIVFVEHDNPRIADAQVHSYLLDKKPELLDKPKEMAAEIVKMGNRKKARVQKLEAFWIDGAGAITGFIVALFGVLVVGVLLASVAGRALWHILEGFLMRTPGLKKVYPYIKQITDFMFSEKKLSFLRVVAIQYPCQGVWSIGFVTGEGIKKVTEKTKKQMLSVFIPTSPTPFTGFVVMTAADESVKLEMTVEEAMRFTISGGVITPADSGRLEASTSSQNEEAG